MTSLLLDTDLHRDEYLQGQQLQWSIFCGAAGRTGRARRSFARGARVEVVVDGETSVHWLQDDPARRTFVVERAEGPALVCPEHRALRIGGYWYTCPPQDPGLRQAGTSAGSSPASAAASRPRPRRLRTR